MVFLIYIYLPSFPVFNLLLFLSSFEKNQLSGPIPDLSSLKRLEILYFFPFFPLLPSPFLSSSLPFVLFSLSSSSLPLKRLEIMYFFPSFPLSFHSIPFPAISSPSHSLSSAYPLPLHPPPSPSIPLPPSPSSYLPLHPPTSLSPLL